MRRLEFMVLSAAALTLPCSALAKPPSPAVGQSTNLSEMLGYGFVAPKPGDWVRYTLGYGSLFLEQIGFGQEQVAGQRTLFIETQTGMPGGSCNPNTLKKTYVSADRFGPLGIRYPVMVYVARNGTMVSHWDDVAAKEAQGRPRPRFGVLDGVLDDNSPCVITDVRSEVVAKGKRRFEATRITCASPNGGHRDGAIQRLQVWHSNSVPLGIVAMRAAVAGIEPFKLDIDSFGRGHYESGISEPLDSIRAAGPVSL
jgi:hypothetical protein